MSFKVLSALAFSAVVLAAPRAADSLTVSVVPTADSFKSSEVTLNATVSNPTDKDLKVVKFNTVLDDLPTMSFKAQKGNKDVSFTGIRVVPDLTKDEAYVTIPAGGSVSVQHKLGSAYDYSASGKGKYSFAASASRFQTDDSKIIDVKIDAVDVDVSEAEEQFGTETTTPTCDNQDQLARLQAILDEARALSGGAATDVHNNPGSAVYASYFGGSDTAVVASLFDTIAGDEDSAGTRIFACTDNGYCAANPGVAAWTDLAWTGDAPEDIVKSDIYVCGGWQDWPDSAGLCENKPNVRGQIMVHEMTHAVAKTSDIYGCDTVTGISDEEKVGNADNYACFAAQIHRDYNC